MHLHCQQTVCLITAADEEPQLTTAIPYHKATQYLELSAVSGNTCYKFNGGMKLNPLFYDYTDVTYLMFENYGDVLLGDDASCNPLWGKCLTMDYLMGLVKVSLILQYS